MNAVSSVMKLAEVVDVVIGVDTHVATHSAAAIDARNGAVLAELTVEATGEGYAELLGFAEELAEDHGALRAWAIEGTGSHGRGLLVHLHAAGELVVELDRPERPHRRGGVKSDPADAVRAAREAVARADGGALASLGSPRGAGTDPEHAATRQALAVRLLARRSAVQAAGDARRQLFSLVLTAPEPVRARLRGLKAAALISAAARLSTTAKWATIDLETRTTVTCLRQLAHRIQHLQREADQHEREIRDLVRSWRPELLEEPGIGPISAATILCAWSHPGRLRSEAAFAKLAGTSPIEATSGQIKTRHRLNRYGDRRLNCALHTIAINRQRHHQATRDYTARRITEGKTPREIRRCLKRYIARDLYRLLERPTPLTPLDRT
jgi:transposase